MIFLFKWVADDEPAGPILSDSDAREREIFFASQVINNACATQAILSILLNSASKDIDLGKGLNDLKEFCFFFDPYTKGLTLTNSSEIRAVHNSFARQTLFEMDSKSENNNEDVFHYVGYVPINGRLYELDGLKKGPIDLGECGDDWLQTVRPIIEKRIKKYSEGEIHFNLMAVISDRQMLYQRQIDELMATGGNLLEVTRLEELMQEDRMKKNRYRVENIRRQHNFLPLIVELLKMLGESGQLMPLYEKAKQRAMEKDSAKAKAK